MSKVKEFWNICKADGAIGGWICLLTSAFLLVTSLFMPPKGVIDSTVIAGVGELFAFAALFKLPNIIQSISDGKSVTVAHGSTSVTVASRDEEEDDKTES